MSVERRNQGAPGMPPLAAAAGGWAGRRWGAPPIPSPSLPPPPPPLFAPVTPPPVPANVWEETPFATSPFCLGSSAAAG